MKSVEPKSLKLMEMAKFIKSLGGSIGPIQGSRLGPARDLFVSPTSYEQQLFQVGSYSISCRYTSSEAFNEGVLKDVPPSVSEEDILSLLSFQGVCEVQQLPVLSCWIAPREAAPKKLLTFA